MESIEKLRELAADINSTEIISHLDVVGKFMFNSEWLDSWHKAFDAACDEIEREVADKIDDLMATSVGGYPEPFNTPDAMHMVLGTAADCFDTPQEAVHYLRGEASMLLPVDADGVPIHVGDELYNGEVIAFGGLAEGGVVFVHRGFMDGNYILEAFASNVTHHIKPRTIEDVLRDCCNEWNKHAGNDWESGVYAKYADELRGMGVGE